MRRLPAAAFAVLVLATVGAFFVTQHLKVENPLIQGDPRPDPPAVNPIAGRVCKDLLGRRVSFRRTKLNFFLQKRSDTVEVYVFNSQGEQTDIVNPGRYMTVNRRSTFTWDGREGQNHGPVAPDGTYYFRVALLQEGRTISLTATPVRVITTPPHPRVTRVVVTGAARSNGPAILSPPARTLTIHFTPGQYHNAEVQILRTDLPGKPRVVKSFGVNGRTGKAVWDGSINGQPAPAGTYLVGMSVTDQACNPGTFPVVEPPAPGSTPHAGVTIRYLAVEPPLTPVTAGSDATVLVDARQHAYSWALRRAGYSRLLERGSERAGDYMLNVRLPPFGAGLYELAVRSGTHRTVVPLIASAGGRRAAAPVLVVVPALTWQGENPVDDDGGGLPDTLVAGDRVTVQRPLVDGLPADFGAELELLRYLDRRHLGYQLTSDVALATGAGPTLAGHTGVVLDGDFRWLPASLVSSLGSYARTGGRVLSVGTGSLQSEVALRGSSASLTAGPPAALSVDPFGAHHGGLAPADGNLITVIDDHLGIFGSTLAFPGFGSYELITPPNGAPTSLAGTADGTPAITGFRDGRGTVVEIGLPGFSASLQGNVDSQELFDQVWRRLSS